MKLTFKAVSVRKLWPIGLILLLTGFAVWTAGRYLTNRTAEVEERLADRASKTRVTVVVPIRDLQAEEVLDLSILVTRTIPRDYVNADAITQETVGQFLGKRLKRPVTKGTPLLQSFVSVYEFKPFSTSIEPGNRAITLPIDEINSVSGLLTAGDKIDILVLTQANVANGTDKAEMQLLPLLESVIVRATGTTTQRELVADSQQSAARPGSRSAGNYNTVTIAVPPRDAQRLVLAQQAGRIIALLRRPDDPALYGKRLSTSEVFDQKQPEAAREKLDAISYIIGGNFASGSQGMQAAAGLGGAGGINPGAVKKLMEAMGRPAN